MMELATRSFSPGEKKLIDLVPPEFSQEYIDTRAFKMKDVGVKEEIFDRPWIGPHKHVCVWWILDNGYAVAWNENPWRGWSFPVEKVK